MPKTKRDVIMNVASVIAAQKDILTPLELANKILGMKNVAAVDREEIPRIDIKPIKGVGQKSLEKIVEATSQGYEGWVKEIK